jgi:hypothetical protein
VNTPDCQAHTLPEVRRNYFELEIVYKNRTKFSKPDAVTIGDYYLRLVILRQKIDYLCQLCLSAIYPPGLLDSEVNDEAAIEAAY